MTNELPEGIIRYELDPGHGYNPLASMEPTGSAFDGDWVRYEDYAAAIARAAAPPRRRRAATSLAG